MPRFSANLGFLWPDLPLLGRIEAAHRAGFAAIEMHFPYETPAGDVRDLCDRLGLIRLGINTAPGKSGEFGLAALPGRSADFEASFDQAITYARAIGGNSVHAMAGMVPADQRPAGFATIVENLKRAADKAPDLTILLEAINHFDRPDFFYDRVDQVAEVIAAVGAPNVKLMFDAYHCGRAEGEVIARLGQHFAITGHIQIAAVPSRHEPDEGDLDYAAFFRAVDDLGYTGWIGAEYKPRGDTDAGMVWREKLGVSV